MDELSDFLSQINILRDYRAELFILVILLATLYWRRNAFSLPASIGKTAEDFYSNSIGKKKLGFWENLFDKLGWIKKPFEFKSNIKLAFKAIKRLFAIEDDFNKAPLYLLLGEESVGKTTLLKSLTNRNEPKWVTKAGGEENPSCRWWAFNEAIVLDIAGKYYMSEAESANEKTWDDILSMVRGLRPQKPIDGIILCFPAEKFLKELDGAEYEAYFASIANRINRRLWSIQKSFGFIVPIYALITKSDKVKGFSDFWKPLSNTNKSLEIFGWSNPNSLDTSFSSDLLDNAFDSLDQDLKRIQIEAASLAVEKENSDDFFLFPKVFQDVFSPIKILLEIIFKQSAFYQSFYFRGFYFSGEMILTAAGKRDKNKPRSNIWFLWHLFHKKIFAESNLAEPAQKSYFSRKNSVRAIQWGALVFAAVWALGLFIHGPILKSNSEKIRNALMVVRDYVDVKREVNFGDAQRLIDKMSAINTESLHYVSMPMHIFSPIEGNINNYFQRGFEKTIFKWMYEQLVERPKDIIGRQDILSQLEQETKSAFLAGKNYLGVRELQNLLKEIKTFESNVDTYNIWSGEDGKGRRDFGFLDRLKFYETDTFNSKLSLKQDLALFGSLAKYLFGVSLTPEFEEDSAFYQNALGNVNAKPFEKITILFPNATQGRGKTYPTRILNIADKFGNKFYRQIILEDPFYKDLADIVEIVQQTLDNPNEDDSKKTLISLNEKVEKLQNDLLADDWHWLYSENDSENNRVPVCSSIETILNSDLLRSFRVFLASKESFDETVGLFNSENCDTRIREKILSKYIIRGIGPVLIKADIEMPVPVINPLLTEMLSGLRLLTGKECLEFDEGPPTIYQVREEPPLGKTMMWNMGLLNQARDFYEKCRDFSTTTIEGLPKLVQKGVDKQFKVNLEKKMMAWLDEAQYFVAEQDEAQLGKQISFFLDNKEIFQDLLRAFVELKLTVFFTPDWFYKIYVLPMLERVDDLTTDSALYAEKERIDSWDGSEEFLSYAFGLKGDKEIDKYWSSQISRIIYIVDEYASPLVKFLETLENSENGKRGIFESNYEFDLIEKWKNNIEEIERYKRKDLKGEVAKLQKLLQNDWKGMTALNCIEKLPQFFDEENFNLFSHTREHLISEVSFRCDTLTKEQLDSRYNVFAKRFNDQIYDNYPFVSKESSLQDGTRELDPRQLNEFFRYFDQFEKNLGDRLKFAAERNRRYKAAYDFVLNFREAREFFKKISFNVGSDQVFKTDLDIDFRVWFDKSYQTAKQIISWQFASGDQIVSYDRGKKAKLYWKSGMPLKLQVRWASDSPFPPKRSILDEVDGQAVVAKNVAQFTRGGQWALFKLIQQRLPAEELFPEGKDKNPYVLEFTVPTNRDNSHGEGFDPLQTVCRNPKGETECLESLYIRLSMSAIDPKTGLSKKIIIPNKFPSRKAPLLIHQDDLAKLKRANQSVSIN